MTDQNKYDGSTNPFDDPDEIVTESAQDYTSLHLPPRQVQHRGEHSSIENCNNNYNQKLTTTNNGNNIHNNSKSSNPNENSKFLQKFTKWFNIRTNYNLYFTIYC